MVKKKFLLIGLFLLFILFFNPAKAEILSSNSERTCNKGQCVQTIYASPRFENYQGNWFNITDVIKTEFNYSTGNIKYSYGNDYYAIARLFFVVNVTQTVCNAQSWNWLDNHCYLWWSQAKTFMETNGINYNVIITKDPIKYKYALNLSSIPSNYADKILYIGMHLENTSGNIDWNDVQLDNGNVIIKNKVTLSYDDLLNSGYTLNLYDKRTVLIGNVTNKNNLWLDPTVTIINSTSVKAYTIGDSSLPPSIPYHVGPTEFTSNEYIQIGAIEANYVYFIDSGYQNNFLFNYTLPSYTTIYWIYTLLTFKGGGIDTLYTYMWNYSSNSWKQVNSSAYSTSYLNYTYNLTSLFTDFIQNNIIRIDYLGSDPLYGDYAYLKISYLNNVAPTYSSNISSYPSNYSSTNATQLNVTWNDDLDSNGYNFSFIQVDSTNYTASRDGNKSYYSIVLPAGTHWWKAYANDSSNAWNSTDNVSFTIGNGTVPLTLLSNVTWTATYPSSSNVTGNGCPSPLTCNLYRNGTIVTGDNNILLGVSVYNYTWNTTGNANYSSNSTTQLLTINKGSTSINLYLNVTEGNKFYKNNSVANFTAVVNVSGLTVNLNGNYTFAFSPSSGTTSLQNLTTLSNSTNQIFNITGYFSGNTNYTASSTTYYAYLDVTNPTVYLFELNDSYINFNQTIRLSVNVTDSFNISAVLAEIQTSGGTKNFTLSSGNNYTYDFTKSDLGSGQDNATIINITKIYSNDTSNNQATNVSTLQFYYGLTNHSSSQSVTEIYNSISDSVTWNAYYNEQSTNNNITSGCTLNVFGNSYAMDYSDKYSRTVSTYLLEGEYTWTINCTNNSYQSQSSQGTITVRRGSTGGIETGGGGGSSYQIIQEKPQIQVVYGNTSFEIIRPYTGSVELYGIPGKKSNEECFTIKNTGSNNISLDIFCVGDICSWVTITKPSNLKLYLDPNEEGDVCYYVTIPSDQPICTDLCLAFKIQALDQESRLYVTYISKWSVIAFPGLRDILIGLSDRVFRIKYFGTPNRKIPFPMIFLPFMIALPVGYVTWRFKYKYWAGLVGMIAFILVFSII